MEHCNACGHKRPLKDGICEWCRKALDKEPVGCGYVVDSGGLTALADSRAIQDAVAGSDADSETVGITLAALRVLEQRACQHIPDDPDRHREQAEYQQDLARYTLKDLRDRASFVRPWYPKSKPTGLGRLRRRMV